MNKIKVLFIDDEKIYHSMVRECLESKKIEVITALSGEEGFDKAIETDPNLIIVDLIMPNKDGFELCRKLRERPETSKTPIIMLTGFEAENLEGRSKHFGADELLKKPFFDKTLQKTVNNLLQRS